MDEKYLQQIYAELSKKYGANKILPYNDFVNKISTDTTFQKSTYDEFAKQYGADKILPYDQFQDKVKKKVGGQESTNGEENSLPTSNAPQQTTSVDFNKLNALQGGSQAATPSQREMADYGVHVQEATKEAQDKKIDEAADNSATLYFKNNPSLLRNYSLSSKKPSSDKFSLTQLRNASPYQQKVTELRTKVKDGELITATDNDGKIIVARPAGKWNTFKEGVSEAWNASTKADNYLKLSADDKIKFLQEHKPSEYLPEKADAESGLYQLGSAVPIVAKTVTGSAAGALIGTTIPETGGLTEPIAQTALPAIGAWMMTVPDMAKQSQMNAEIDAFHKIKAANPTMDDKEILKEAQKAGTVGYAEGLATGTAMNFIGGGLPENTGQGLWKATGQFLRNQPKSIAEIGALSGATSLATEETKKALGVPVTSAEEWDKMGKAMNNGAIMQLAFNVTHGVMATPKYVKAQANQVLSNVSPEELQALQQKAVEAGFVNQAQVDNANESLNEYKEAQQKVIPTGNQEKDAVITGLVQKKNNLEKLKSETDKSYHDEIDAQIENADQRIQLAKQTNDPIKYAEQDDLDGTKNFNPKPFDELSKKEVEGIATEIPKEYGDAEVEEVGGGEGSERKYKANPTVNRQQGFIKIKDKISVEDKVYNDKADAEAASQKALAQHYYEHGMDETLKPEKKSNVTVILPKENNAPNEIEKVKVTPEQGDAGSNKINEPIPAENTGNTETTIPETIPTAGTQQTIPQQENIGGQNASSIESPTTLGEQSRGTQSIGGTGSEGVGQSKQGTELTRAQDRATQESSNGEIPPTNGEGKVGVYVQYPQTQLSHAGTERISTEHDFENENKYQKSSVLKWNKEADDLIEKGFDIKGTLDAVDKGEHVITPAERVVLTRYAAELESRLRSMKDPANPEYDRTLRELKKVTDAADFSGSESGANLRAIALVKTVAEGSYADFMLSELDANNGADLTNNQKAKALNDYTEYQQAKKDWEEKISNLEAENAKLKAENELKKNTKPKTEKAVKKTHEDYVAERKTLKEQLAEAKAKHEQWLKDSNISKQGASPFVLTVDMVKVIKKIIESHIDEGVTKLADLTKSVLDDAKDILDGLTEKNIHDIIAGEYNEKKQTKKDLAITKENLRIEAQLINKLEALQNFKPKNEKQTIKRNQEIEALKKKIKDWNDETPDREAQLKRLKVRNEKETQRIQEKIDKGDFAPDEKKKPLTEQEELKQKFPNLIKDVISSRDALIKKRNEIALRRAKQMYENRTPQEKLQGNLVRGLNVPRTLMASMDFSAPLRQSVIATVAHPILAKRAAKFMFEATKDEKVYNRWLDDVHNDPMWNAAEKSGLAVTDPSTLHLKEKEEAFLGSSYAEQIPGIGGLVKGSERAYVGFLNKMRWDLFNQYAEGFQKNGYTYENSPDLYKGLASFVNASTGRGGMSKIESAAPVLNVGIFSPRLIASRMNMLGLTDIPNLIVRGVTLGKRGLDYGFYTKLPKQLRIEAAKDMLKFVSVGITTLALAKSLGAEVEADPRSSDFGKIKSGNTRWDIWGGFQPYARLLSQLVTGQSKSANSGKVYDLNGEKYGGKDRGDQLESFFRGKLAPIPSFAWDVIKGRTVGGGKVNRDFSFDHPQGETSISGELLQHIIPLLFQDVYDAYKDKGISRIFTAGIPSIFGVGVQTYQPKLPSPSTKGSHHSSSHTVSHGHH